MTTVTVYTSAGCMPCRQTKRHLDKRGIGYTEVPIDSDEGIVAAATYLGFSTAPIVCVSVDGREETWDGYRPDRIDAIVRVA